MAEAWNFLCFLHSRSTIPWCIACDFNDMLRHEDKKGWVLHLEWFLRGFQEVIDECNLNEIKLHGHPFTWERGRGTGNWV